MLMDSVSLSRCMSFMIYRDRDTDIAYQRYHDFPSMEIYLFPKVRGYFRDYFIGFLVV